MANNMLQSLLFSGGGSGGGSGGDGGVLVVHQDENGVLDKTWKEIHDAPFAVLYRVVVGAATTYCPILTIGDEGGYFVDFIDSAEATDYIFSTDSENGYPAIEE
jgi:hypothetical protein